MKEIKFKAWDNVARKMYSVGGETDVHFYLDSGGIKAEKFFETIHYTPEGGSDVCGDSETLEHLIYLQYTDLKDKNGVEIYEGDIFFDDHNEEFGRVIFEEGKFLYETTTFVTDLFEIADALENRGNIYEQSHLLEGDKNA